MGVDKIEFTIDYIIYILGILLGIGFTLFGVAFTDYLKDKRIKIRLTIAFKNEVLANLQKANFNLSLLNETIKERRGARQTFYTVAYEQLKLNFIIDWRKSKIASNIFDGFIFSEEYNERIGLPELYKKEMGSEKVVLEQIKKNMLEIDHSLKNYRNIESVLNK